MRKARSEARRERGRTARKAGRAAELWAVAWLMLLGWRILAFRLKTQGVEIDLLARRGPVLAVIEVKRRRTLEEALEAVSFEQRRRLRRAAQAMAKRPGLADLSIRLDLLALAPGRLPRHIPDAWPDGG